MGGATFSEFRVGYEVSNDRKNWEVIVGEYLKVVCHTLAHSLQIHNSFLNIRRLSNSNSRGVPNRGPEIVLRRTGFR